MEYGDPQHRPDRRLVLIVDPALAGGLTRDSSASVMAFNNAYTYLVLSGLTRMRASTT